MRGARRLAGVMGLLSLAAWPVRAQGVHWEFWPEIDAYKTLIPGTRLLLLTNYTDSREIQFHQLEVGAYIDSKLASWVSVRGGYSYLGSVANPSSDENRAVAAATFSVDLPSSFRFQDRNRFDFRWLSNDFKPRYRNRPRIERGVDLGDHHSVTPYLQTEAYYDLVKKMFTRIETQIGAEWQFTKQALIDFGLVHKNDKDPTVDDVNALALTLTLNF